MNRNTNERLLRAKEAAGYLGIAVSTLWLWNKQDKIPKPFKLTPNTTVWRHSEIQEFMEKMMEENLPKNEPVRKKCTTIAKKPNTNIEAKDHTIKRKA